jgi:hypothetical protein
VREPIRGYAGTLITHHDLDNPSVWLRQVHNNIGGIRAVPDRIVEEISQDLLHARYIHRDHQARWTADRDPMRAGLTLQYGDESIYYVSRP